MLAEKVGVQTQTSCKDPQNWNLRRIVLGPHLYFKADGSKDTDPIHYWGYVLNFYETLNILFTHIIVMGL